MEEPSFLEDMEKIKREMCNIEGNFMSSIFLIKNLYEINKWLNESYLNNNKDIHKLKTQTEQLLERLQDTCSSSYVLGFHMVDCFKDCLDDFLLINVF